MGLLVFMRPSPEYPNGQLDPAAYPPFAATLAVAMCAIILLSAWKTRSRIPHLARPDGAPAPRGVVLAMFRDLAESLRNRSFRALFLGNTLAFVTWGTATALSLHLGTYFWRASTDQLVLWGIANGAGLFAGLAFWSRQARLRDKKPVFVQGLVIYVVFMAGAHFARVIGWWPDPESAAYIPAFILTTGTIAHFGLASTMVTGGSMMADVTDEDALHYGRRREGIFFGALYFTAKTSFGIGSQIAGYVVDFVGIAPGARPETVGPEVVRALGLALGFSVLVLLGLSIAFFSRYDLTRERHASVRAALDARVAPGGG